MSLSSHRSVTTRKKSSAKSNHRPAAIEEATTAATSSDVTPATSAAPTGTPVVNGSPATPLPLTPTASAAIAKLDALEASLNLNIVVPPNDKAQIRALNRVSDAALGLASDIVSSAPAQFANFAAIAPAVQQIQAMSPVAARAVELGVHLQKSIQNQRTPAAIQTLALYAVVKGLGRLTGNETMREKIPQLKAELAPKRKIIKPKQTQGEKTVKRVQKAQAKRVQKAMAVLAALGPQPGATAPAAAGAAATALPAPQPTSTAEAAPVATPATSSVAPAAPSTPATPTH